MEKHFQSESKLRDGDRASAHQIDRVICDGSCSEILGEELGRPNTVLEMPLEQDLIHGEVHEQVQSFPSNSQTVDVELHNRFDVMMHPRTNSRSVLRTHEVPSLDC